MTQSFSKKTRALLVAKAANPKGIALISPRLASLRACPGTAPIPKGLHHSAKGWRVFEPALGMWCASVINPGRVASLPFTFLVRLLFLGRCSRTAFLFAFFLSTSTPRADLILEQQSGDTHRARVAIMKLHGDKMRLEQPDQAMIVILDFKTRDSFTLLTTNQTYLMKFGSEVRWEMQEEAKHTHGTNEMDAPPARPVDTGKSGLVDGRAAEIFTWAGAHGRTETLWVATNFPNYNAIRAELLKLDRFNDGGPHRNAQPELSRLPGMVLKSESVLKGHTTTTTLVSVKVEPVDPALFELPKDYSPWKQAENKP